MKRLLMTIGTAIMIAVSGSQAMSQSFKDVFKDTTLILMPIVEAVDGRVKLVSCELTANQDWNGPLSGLSKPFSESDRRVTVFQKSDSSVIYSQTFSSLFDESMMVDPALNNYAGCQYNDLVKMPMPRHEVTINLEKRGSEGDYHAYHSIDFNPNRLEEHLKPIKEHVELVVDGVSKISDTVVYVESGFSWPFRKPAARRKIKVMMVSLGFEQDSPLFDSVSAEFKRQLMEYEPFKTHSRDFEFKKFDIGDQIKPDYNVFGADRYIGIWNMPLLRMAIENRNSLDHFVLFVNNDKYAGGGIFNDYAVFTSGHKQSIQGMIHEFGHSFANLPDEYEGDVFESKERPESHCIMRVLSEHQFCPECQAKILKAIKYWTGGN